MTLLIIIFVVFFFFNIIGYHYRNSTVKDTWLYADKKISTLYTAMSTIATTVGGSATILLAYMVYKYGWWGLVIDLPVGFGILLLAVLPAMSIRQTNASTVPELIGIKYGTTLRKITAMFIIITEIAWFGLLIKAFNVFLPENAILSRDILLIITGTLFLIYIYLSGQRGVYKTDLIQAILIIAGFIILMVLVLTSVPGKTEITWQFFELSIGEKMSFFIMMFLSGLTGPVILSRLFYAENPQSAKNGLLWGGIIKIVVSLVVALVVLKGASLFIDPITGYDIFPGLINYFFNSPFAQIMIVLFLIVMVSSADTVLMTAITTLNNDLLRENITLAKIKSQVWILGIAGIALALYFSTILDIMKFAYTFYAAGPAMFVLYSLFDLKISPRNAVVIILISGMLALVISLITQNSTQPVVWAIGANILLTVILKDSNSKK